MGDVIALATNTRSKSPFGRPPVLILNFLDQFMPTFADKEKKEIPSVDTVFVVSGFFGFCSKPYRDRYAEVVNGARRAIWISNDYTAEIPSQVRRANWVARLTMSPDADFIMPWSNLSFHPRVVRPKVMTDLMYYGALRPARVGRLEEYLRAHPNMIVSCSARQESKWEELGARRVRDKFISPYELSGFTHSIIISDPGESHGIPDRFFECLSANVALYWDHKSDPMEEPVQPGSAVLNVADPEVHQVVADRQWERWGSRDWHGELKSKFEAALRELEV